MKTTDLFGRPIVDRTVFKSSAGSGIGRTRSVSDIKSRVEQGDCIAVLKQLADEGVQFDACVTDPPYHLTATVSRFKSTTVGGDSKAEQSAQTRSDSYGRLATGFMGQSWDGGDIAFRPETWAAVADVLRPGAFLLVFGGTRTHHRVWCAIEDAGLVIQDSILDLIMTDTRVQRFVATLSMDQTEAFSALLDQMQIGGTLALDVRIGIPKAEGSTEACVGAYLSCLQARRRPRA